MKKKKREESSQVKVLLFSALGIGLLAIALIIPLMIGWTATPSFATEPWLDPHQICTTQWVYPETDRDNPELVQALTAQNLTDFRVVVTRESAHFGCYASDGTPLTYHYDIGISFTMEETARMDDEQMANIIYRAMTALSSTESSQAWGGIDILSIAFFVDRGQRRSWHMNYAQALAAYEAGLTGLSFFHIGQVR